MLKYMVALLALWLSACGSAPSENTKLLTKQQMTNILIDLHIVETSVAQRSYQGDSVMYVYNAAMNQVYQNHQTDSLQVDMSYRYYIQKPTLMDGIYEKVIDSLSILEALSRNTPE